MAHDRAKAGTASNQSVNQVRLTSCRNPDARAELAPVVRRPPDKAILLGPAHRSRSPHQTHHAAGAGGLGGVPAVAAGANVLISSCLARRHRQVCKPTSIVNGCDTWASHLIDAERYSLFISFSVCDTCIRYETSERCLCWRALHQLIIGLWVTWSVRRI